MPKISPVSWKVLIKFFEQQGWVFDRMNGDHIVYVKPGYARPVELDLSPNNFSVTISDFRLRLVQNYSKYLDIPHNFGLRLARKSEISLRKLLGDRSNSKNSRGADIHYSQ